MTMDRTTVYLDRELLAEARRLARTKGVTDTIQLALTEYVQSKRLQEFAESLGTVDLDLNLDKLEVMRRDEPISG